MQRYAYVNITTTLSLDDNVTDTNGQAMKARIEELARWGSSGYRIVARDEIETTGTRTIYETLERASEWRSRSVVTKLHAGSHETRQERGRRDASRDR